MPLNKSTKPICGIQYTFYNALTDYWFGFFVFNGISTFVAYLMPNPSFRKNSSGTT